MTKEGLFILETQKPRFRSLSFYVFLRYFLTFLQKFNFQTKIFNVPKRKKYNHEVLCYPEITITANILLMSFSVRMYN